ncbi:hypothetical protein LCGC14_2262040 [marine sediment metagenome]|uniref:Phosphoribosyltransferase domain-containing protein n=1 Tax=marine sediment metagenome TaxID=412755 RepID=A0A0F9FBS8_9ZZZZ
MTYLSEELKLITQVYEVASTVPAREPNKYTTVNELTDQIPAVRPDILKAAVRLLVMMRPIGRQVNKVLSEEDKGAILAGLFSVQTSLPLAMARHNVTYEIPGSLVVPLSMEYMDGQLTVNGLEEGDHLLLIDDTLASGGTMVALIEAARGAGCSISDVRVVVEKLGYGGRERLADIGVNVRAGIGIAIDDEGKVSVKEHLEWAL